MDHRSFHLSCYRILSAVTDEVGGIGSVSDIFYEFRKIRLIKTVFKVDFKKWETILSENVISLTRNKDHPNVFLSYMLYCLTIRKQFNLAYYIAKRMESVTRSDVMALPYGMLLTRLFKHVLTSHPYAITDLHDLVDHIMIPLSETRVFRIMPDGKRPHPQTPTESSESQSPTQN
ncbi:hypothetical protein Tco_0774280 [Tanacetum coccineum]|uniref:Pentatricopeptide repeat-containing protein n=1 Tax=Tanacetum coccineum TaxID=301880 RepID=A0ABQ4ZN31_9ASTR